MKLSEYKRFIEPLIKEYFLNGGMDEIINSLVEANAKEYSYEFVKRIINMSFDRSDRERELVSQLLSYGYPNFFSTSVVGKGFERLFEVADEVVKDAPAAHDMLAKFLARAVVDEVLPPAFLLDAVVTNLGGEVVEQAKRMLSRDHSGTLLERGWGPGDGRPVSELKVVIDQFLQEFLLTGDVAEATRCLVELQTRQYLHEVVKRAIVLSLDQPPARQESVSELLRQWAQSGLLSRGQAAKGFSRVLAQVPDLQLDTPAAGSLVQAFVQRALATGVLPEGFSA